MSNRRKPSGTDPRNLPGAIVGPGEPHDRAGVVLDTRHAILLDSTVVSTADNVSGEPSAIAMLLGGRINRTQERAEVLFLLGTDGVAAIVTELLALLGRANSSLNVEGLLADLTARMATLREEGHLS